MMFLMVDKKWFGAKGFLSPFTREEIPLTADKKNIYLVLRDRNRYFKGDGKNHFESQDTLSSLCNVDRRTVGRFVKQLIELGVVKAKKVGRKWYYESVLDVEPYGYDNTHPFFVGREQVEKNKRFTNVQTKKKEKESHKPSLSLTDDDFDDPF